MAQFPLVYKKVRISDNLAICFCKNWVWYPSCGNYGFILLYKGIYRGMRLCKNVGTKTIPKGGFVMKVVSTSADRNKNGAGKGDRPRPFNRKNWEKSWATAEKGKKKK